MTFRQFIQTFNRLHFVERHELDYVLDRRATDDEWAKWRADPVAICRKWDEDRTGRLWTIVAPAAHNQRAA